MQRILLPFFFLFWTTSHPAYLFFFSPPPSHTRCRSGEYWEGHRRHPLLTFLPLKQPALSVFRTWGRGAEADRKPVSIRTLHHDSAHLTHEWHVTLVHLQHYHRQNLTSVGGLGGYYKVSFSVFQWSWSGASTLSCERVWWRVAIGQRWPHTQATGAHMT